MSVILQMGLAGYFLVVWDLIRFAREQGIRVGPGRGSAAGSVVSYCLRITDVDPLRYGLIFERFLNPERIQMPDIDMDFDERRRDEVIRYASTKYGADHVAQIVTFQTIKGKQGIRDAARVLGFPPSVGDRLCKMYPSPVMGRDHPIEEALRLSPELATAYEGEPEAKEIVDTAKALEGLRREDSVHAAGVVIGDAPLVRYLPLKLSKDSRDDSKRIVTQFDMHGVEKLGLLKMDFLGLRNLSVIEDTLRHLRVDGVEMDIDHVALDDPDTYALLCRGETTGVFQMESGGMRSLIKLLEPDRFEDVMALVALYRPGPLNNGLHTEYAERKHGRKPVTYPHPDLETDPARHLRRDGLPGAGHADRRDDGRLLDGRGGHAPQGDGQEEDRVPDALQGATSSGAPSTAATRTELRRTCSRCSSPFADYGFNASHACAYGLVAYQTAYLMAHHPVSYMAAILTSVKDDKDRKPYYLYACRAMDIEVLPPDVNDSALDFAPAASGGRAIRYGLSAVRNVGEGAVQQIIEARDAKGAFESFSDFCRKVDPSVLAKRMLESLILAGAFDSLGYHAAGAAHRSRTRCPAPIVAERKAEAAGQFSLFGGRGSGGRARSTNRCSAGEEFDKRSSSDSRRRCSASSSRTTRSSRWRTHSRAQSTHEIGDLEAPTTASS